MLVCLSNITAFQYLQLLEDIPSVALVRECAPFLNRLCVPNREQAITLLDGIGFKLKPNSPVHILTGLLKRSHPSSHIQRHGFDKLPANALFQVTDQVLCTSPEETYLELASSLALSDDPSKQDKAEVQLALYGMELCGLYYFDAAEGRALAQRTKPLTSTKKLKAYLDQCSCRPGIKLARKALRLVEDGARSPMESACALLLCRPQRIGSVGFERGEMNAAVETSEGTREVDRVWRKYGLGYEYQGREYHGTERRQLEDRRRNALLGSGITLVNIWYEDLARPAAFDDLCKTLAKQMGKRLRYQNPDFRWKQHLLREVVLPGVVRYG